MVGVPWSFLLENLATAVLIIGYLAYELRWGRGATIMSRVDAMITVIVAIARENPNIDEDQVAHELNGDAPSQFQRKQEADS